MGLTDALRRLTGVTPRWQALPTADYYLLAGIGDLVSGDGVPSQGRPMAQLGPHSWACGSRLVIVRYVTPQELAALEARRWQSVHYVIDDLLPLAAESFELPGDYRDRLARFAATLLPRILELQPIVVAPSQAILDLFPRLGHRLLDPCCLALRGCGGLPPPASWQGPMRIAFLGTRSHVGTLPLIDAISARLQQASPQTRLHLFFGRHLPAALTRRANILNRPPIAWPQYLDFCRRTRFHIGLAPVQDTAFAKARSITKLMDHAAVGAVGLYSDRAPFSGVVTHGHDGLLVADDPEAWSAAILELAAAPRLATDMALAGARLAAARGDPMRLRAFWLGELGLGAETHSSGGDGPPQPGRG